MREGICSGVVKVRSVVNGGDIDGADDVDGAAVWIGDGIGEGSETVPVFSCGEGVAVGVVAGEGTSSGVGECWGGEG